MKHTEKKYYSSPEISEIKLDRVVILQANSNGPPPQPDDLFSAPSATSDGETTSSDGTTSKSGFEENPFER